MKNAVGQERAQGPGFYRQPGPERPRQALRRPLGRPRSPTIIGPLALFVLAACSTVPITGRKAFNLVDLDTDKELGVQAYDEALQGQGLLESGNQYEMVRRVFDRLVAVSDEPFREEFDWEVRLVDDKKTVNAWCLPGGKMACYRGILPVAKDDAGLAVVMGHEIGHAVARHGTERMSQQLGVQAVLQIAVGNSPIQLSEVLAVLIFLPWGRKQELEADHIGLIYMARAGYDPRTARDFWTRMAELSGGEAPPELLSTHPSDETRIAQIEQLLPTALEEFEKAKASPAPPPSP